MVWKGVRNEVIGILLSLLIGLAVGGIWAVPPAGVPSTDSALVVLHYRLSDLAIGAAIAVPSGAALALAITAVMSTTIIGVAISTSILPPIIACGINLMRSVLYAYRENEQTAARQHLIFSGLALAMLFVNWALIFVGAGLMLRLKQITPALLQGVGRRQAEAAPAGLHQALVHSDEMEDERRELERLRMSAARLDCYETSSVMGGTPDLRWLSRSLAPAFTPLRGGGQLSRRDWSRGVPPTSAAGADPSRGRTVTW